MSVPTRLSSMLLIAGVAAACGASNSTSTPSAATAQPSAGIAPPAPASAGSVSAPTSAATPRAGAGSSATPSAAGSSGRAGTAAATTTASGAAGTVPSSSPATSASAGHPAAGTSGSAAGTSAAAGTPASAGTQAPAAPSGSGNCPGSLCESFESMPGPMLDASWEIATSNCMGTGAVSVDTMQAHSGTHAIRVQGAGGYCNHVFIRPKSAQLPMNAPLFLRFYVRFDKPLTQSHVTFLALRDEHEMKDLRMGGQSEILMWNRESDDATLPELSPTGIGMSVKPETSKWLCVEVAIDPQGGTLQTSVDGKPVPGLTVEGDPTPDVDAQWKRKMDWKPDLRDVRFGWESYGSDENTLWFDDIAIGTSHLGCGA